MVPAGFSALPLVALLGTYVREVHGRTADLHGGILADPLAEWVRQGRLPGGLDGACEQMASLVQWTGVHAPRLRTIGIDGALWGDAGAHAVQELAFGLAVGVDYLRRLGALGVGVDEAAESMVFSWSLGSSFFLEIAKLRAARLLWARAIEAAGGGEAARRLVAHGRLTGWNKTLLDPHTNLLRATTEAFAAVVGGCQSVEIAPFDAVAGGPTELSSRLARNLHLILAEECQLGRVVDPAGGSHYVETVTRQLAEKAWALFQEVERRGGMAAALAAGHPQDLVRKTAAERVAAVESRRDGVIGTNLHPNLREKLPPAAPAAAFATAPRAAAAPARELDRLNPALVTDSDGVFEALADAFAAGATLAQARSRLAAGDPAPAIEVVVPRRHAEPFEALRRRAEAHLAQAGARPKVFLAPLGPRKQHAARADFSTGFFAAGGFEVVPNRGFETPEAAAAAALASGAPVVVLCSSDETYPALVPPFAGALKAAGAAAPLVVLAGLPAAPELHQRFRSAGIDEFIHLRANCAQLLGGIQDRLGLPTL
jgi:methylmalonyl-CoA mutase